MKRNNQNIAFLRRLLNLENSFYINFKITDLPALVEGVRSGKGFRLSRIYHHPSRDKVFVLEIKTLNSKNQGLDFGYIRKSFSVNNQKNVSPNLKVEQSVSIPEFESKYGIKMDNTKE